MKKLFLICTLALCVTGLYAQESPEEEIVLTPANMEEVLDGIFNQEDADEVEFLPAAERPLKKKWQVAYFATADIVTYNSLNEAIWQLKTQLNQGNLQRAIILYDRKIRKNTQERTFIQGQDGLYLYVIQQEKKSASPKKTTAAFRESESRYQYQKISIQEGTDISALLDYLLNKLSTSRNLYSYFRVEAHGEGAKMSHYHKGTLNLATVMESINKRKIYIDILEIFSCLMGTVTNVNKIFATESVGHILISSNILSGLGTKGNTPLFDYFDKAPREASENALKAYFSSKYCPKGKCRSSSTYNKLLIHKEDAKPLKKFDTWIQNFYPEAALVKEQLPASPEKHTKRYQLISARKLLSSWTENLPMCNGTDSQQCRKLTQVGKSLYQILSMTHNGGIIAKYRCWDNKEKTIFYDINQLPENSECIDGLSIKKSVLLANNRNENTEGNPDTHSSKKELPGIKSFGKKLGKIFKGKTSPNVSGAPPRSSMQEKIKNKMNP